MTTNNDYLVNLQATLRGRVDQMERRIAELKERIEQCNEIDFLIHKELERRKEATP